MSKTYIISTAVPNQPYNHKFNKAIETFCKKNDAELLILVSSPVYVTDELASSVPQSKLVLQEKLLNSKIRISTIPVNPQAIDPVTGLQRQAQKDGSFIFASPKQRLEVVPTSNSKLPHALMTTGAITKPLYRNTRNGMIAAQDHVNGALIVEVVNSIEYHFRHVQADSNGSFIDLFTRYTPEGTESVNAEAIVPGDIHSGSTDSRVKKAIFELVKLGNPKYLVLHDFSDAISANPHLKGKNLSKAKLANQLNINKELDLNYKDLIEYAEAANQVVLVASNHPDFFNRWIESGEYISDPTNYRLGHELALAMLNGKDPFEHAMQTRDTKGKIKNVTFLDIDEDFRLTKDKVQLGAHGHLGPNGARGSAANLEKSYGNAMIGHSHSIKILRGLYQVGTSTLMDLGYNKGPSSWVQSIGILYPNGNRQLVNIINGKYRG